MSIPIEIIAFLIVLAVNESKGSVGDVNLCALDGDAGSSASSGVLEVLTGSGWSAVSLSGFGGVEAQVVCAQLGYSFVSSVSMLSVTSRQLEFIIEHITCNGNESSLSDCLLDVSQNPQATNWSLVYLSCDTVHNTSNDTVLFLVDNPFYMASKYPEVNRTLFATYTMIEPSQSVYNEGCLTEVCMPGAHFYNVIFGTAILPDIYLPLLRDLNCSSRELVRISLTEFQFISDCISRSTDPDKITMKDDQQFCSIVSVTTTNAAVIQSMRFCIIMMIVIMIVGGAMDLFT